MTQLFDAYDKSYGDVVESSIDFSGLPHGFFMSAKAVVVGELVDAHFGAAKPDALDIGCGVGALHPYLGDRFSRLRGADISAACIERARRDNPGNEYKVYDGTTLPYDAATFDMALAACVLHHVPPRDWPSFVQEHKRVVRPGGLVCVIEHNPFNPLTRLGVARCEFDRDAVLLRAARVRGLMSDAGLRAVRTRYFLFLPSRGACARWVEHRLAWLAIGAQYMTYGVA
jgi:SAM-dependent methyltransferase